MSIPSFWILLAFTAILAVAHLPPPARSEASPLESAVLNLDASNFTNAVASHPFLLVNFYAPWCGHCKELAPEYEKAASILRDHDAPIALAKVDASDDTNRDIASKYHVQGFPTLKIFKNEGKDIQEYKGPDEADGIVEYLKKQLGPASTEIKTKEDVGNLFDDKKIFIVGIFPQYTGEEFENFMLAAEKLRADYDFGHTLDSKLLPRGDQIEDRPIVRLFKPFDELFVDSQDFQVDALENFIEESSIPIMTIFSDDPDKRPFLLKFFNHPNAKAMLFVNFTSEHFDAFMSKHHEVAKHYKGNNISFLIGDVNISKAAFEYFGLNEDQVPLILIEEEDGQKYLKQNLEPEHIQAWIQDYKDGKLTPFRKSEPIPEANDEPVKVVVADSIQDVLFNSRKNVFLELYAPWCGHCKKLAPVLDEVAISFKDDANVIIAKMDATKNDVPTELKDHGYPTLYFSSASGNLVLYDGGRKAEDIIDFIQKNSDLITTATDSVKDEL